jgi:RNA polymerase sigma factor (TIGR02999 family)
MDAKPITVLLDAARCGDAAATESLFNAVYAELKLLARSNRRRWRGNSTMNTTALIHEVFIKLAGQELPGFENRVHFYATASRAMRQVLVNYAQAQRAAKRGGDALHVTMDESVLSLQASADELLMVHQLLSDLEQRHPRRCRIIEYRVFGGMTVEEVAEVLSVSTATVKREWRIATAELYRALQPDGDLPQADAGQ